MAQDYHPISLALCLGRADIVLPHNLQHGAAGCPHDSGRGIHAQRNHRHDVALRTLKAQCRQPLQFNAKDVKEQRTDNEPGHRNAAGGNDTE